MHTPSNTLPLNRPFIGFIRVSTQRQAEKGLSLEAQKHLVKEYVVGNGGDLRLIYGDHATGMGDHAFLGNAELLDALKASREIGAILVVTDVTRLGRSERLVDVLDVFGVDLLSIRDGRILSRNELRLRLRSAQKGGENNRAKTRRALAGAKRRGVALGNRSNLRHAQRKGQLASRIKRDMLVETIVRILRRHDPGLKMNAKEAATLLNLGGLRTGQGNLWTRERVRPLLRSARAHISSRWFIGL